MHESGHIVGSLKDLGVHIAVDEVEQLIKNFFDIAHLIQVGHDQRMLGQELLLFLLEPLFKFIFDLLLFIFKLFLQIKEAFINIFHLLKLKSLQFFLYLLQQLAILIIEPLCVEDHLLQVQYILLKTGSHFFNLDELVAVVLVKDALDADCAGAEFAKVFDWLVIMSWAVNVVFWVDSGASWSVKIGIGDQR